METSCTILDLKNVTLKQVASVYGYIQEASKIGQNYYPERMGIPPLPSLSAPIPIHPVRPDSTFSQRSATDARPLLHDQLPPRLLHRLASHKTLPRHRNRLKNLHPRKGLSSDPVIADSQGKPPEAVRRRMSVSRGL